MIRYTATGKDGRRVIGLGLEAGNIARLMDGQPIHVDGAALNIPFDIIIHYGTTKNDMIEKLREAGAELPPEKDWKR